MNTNDLASDRHAQDVTRRPRPLAIALAVGASLMTLTLILSPTTDAALGVLFVDADATGGADDGSSWADAYTELQSALAAAVPGDEIWVAEGVYRPDYDPTSGTHTGYVTATFVLTDGVALYGGFDPSLGVELFPQRDWETHVTILSGDLGDDDTTDTHGVVTDTAHITGGNAYHVTTGSATDDTAVLDGFTITGGYAHYSLDANDPNNSGGGMYNEAGNPTLRNLTFIGNAAQSYGGGMENTDASSPILTNVTFRANAAGNGGGMENYDSDPTLRNVTFDGNTASFGGGGMYNYQSDPTLVNVVFSGNTADSYGGGMCNEYYNYPTLTNVVFSGNSALTYDGGGIFNYYSNPMLTNVTFSGNEAHRKGGAIGNNSSSLPEVRNTILWGNSPDQIANNANVSYSLVEGSTVYTGTGNINDAPLFVRTPDPGDGDWTTLTDNDYGDLRLRSGSPAIDAGDNGAVPLGVTTDLAGRGRLRDGDRDGTVTVDIGAHERPGIVYVDADATGGADDGSSWADAYTELQSALAAAVPGDEIWVAEGVYRPDYDPTSGTHTGYVTATFALTDDVALYGGFDPSLGADTLAERDWRAHVTVLSGDLGGDDTADAHGVVTDTAHLVGDNAQTAVMGSGVTETAVLDGFTITAGNANGSEGNWWQPHRSGGGIYNQAGSPTLANIILAGNHADRYGGGMYNTSGSTPTLTDVTFISNKTELHGGGMSNHSSDPTLTDVAFTRNQAYHGGGMHNNLSSNPVLVNVAFSGNAAEVTGGGMRNSSSTPSLVNVTFTGNVVGVDGGGMYNSGGSAPTLANVSFSGNEAQLRGGGMYNLRTDPSLVNCLLWGNSSRLSGDQIGNYESSPTISYSDVEGCGGSGSWDTYLGIDGGGNIDADPEFVRAPDPGADAIWGTADDDYGDLRLQLGSPAIDAGDDGALPPGVTTDLVDRPRVIGRVDLGAYESGTRSCLPLMMRSYVVAPNLVVGGVIAASDGITVVIENVGDEAAVDDFWVDAYIDPETTPTAVNQTWDMVGSRGLVWGVTADIAPGEALTLTVGGDYYAAAYSTVTWPLAAGTPVYVQVDSAHASTDYGAVLETHEITGGPYDNVAGPRSSTAAGGRFGQPTIEEGG